jgi:XrtJ-associated TM-motif-TM protein
MLHPTRLTSRFLLAVAVLCMPVICHAQGGCVDSPENPTALLALVGTAGAVIPMLRSRLRSRK